MNLNDGSNTRKPSEQQSVSEREQMLMQNFILQQKLANLAGQNVSERLVNTKGSGAYGTFTVTHDISQFSKSKLFSKIGNSCRVFVRFSSVNSEKGSADTTRDLRGFAIKFYTEEGNWDLVGSSFPTFFIKDPEKFPTLLLAQKRDPRTNLKSETRLWEFFSSSPESLHTLLMLYACRGIPQGYRHMNGYGTHTFSFINEENEKTWVKFHLISEQGIKNISLDQSHKIAGENPDFAQQDLVEAIESGNFPKWKVCVQLMSNEQAADFRWNPFDTTKVWYHKDFPLIEIGELELNEIPEDYYAHVEQVVFSLSNIINGIGFSPDNLLKGRLFSFADAQRNRVGIHSENLEVNKSLVPTQQLDFEYDTGVNINRTENEDDHYTQPGVFYSKILNPEEKEDLVRNIVTSMKKISGPEKSTIINKQLCNFFRTNIELGMKIAEGLGVDIDAKMMSHNG